MINKIFFFVKNLFIKVWNAYADAFELKKFRSAEFYAKKGNVGAMEYVAEVHETGSRVVKKNIAVSYCLYQILSEKNISKAKEKIQFLECQMTDTQLFEAKKYIHDWKKEKN